MKQSKVHPAVAAAKKKMTVRYTVSAVALLLGAILLVLGFFIKPKAKLLEPEAFNKDTAVDTYVKSEISITSPLFSQDILDKNNKVIGERYYVLAVGPENNRFILSVPTDYYEKELSELENNIAQRMEDNKLEILDESKKVEVLGYVREMSTKLMSELSAGYPGYESQLYRHILEISESPVAQNTFNYFFVAAGFIGIIGLFVLLTAISLTAEYVSVKKKHENN